MKKVLSIILTVALILCAVPFGAFTLTASAATSGTTGDCTWTLDGTTLTISGNGAMSGSSAPWGYHNITHVIIEDGVTSISNWAFQGSDRLVSVVIADSVTSIGKCAFSNCYSLTLIELPDSVESIGYQAFDNTEYANDENNYDGDLLYLGNHLIACRTDAEGEIVVKNGTLTVAGGAFEYCSNITSILLPGGVVSLCERAFNDCTGLTSITVPSSVTNIETYAFGSCESLEDVWYGSVKNDKVNIVIDDGNVYLTYVSWHYNICNYDKHKYLAECDSNCENCEWTRTPAAEHNYDNDCDDTCNDCKNTRVPSDHKYKNDCDVDCNVCGAIRTPSEHKYTNSCDTTCNECGEERTITHTYANSCDASCNVCGDIREITHTYDSVCDASCNICGKTRTVPDHVYTNACDKTCNECGKTRTVKNHTHAECFDGYSEEIYGSWDISIANTGVYNLKPNSKYTGEFSIHNIAVYDKNGKEVYYYEKLGGFPLVADQEYTIKFRYDCSDEISGTVSWNKTKKADKIFPDTYASEWYNNAIAYVVGRNIMSGYGSTGLFGTADNIQRQDFMVMLARLDGVDLSKYVNKTSPFSDVPNSSDCYYKAAVIWGYENGIVSGYANGKFGTGDKITREQLVKFLYNYANYKGLDTSYSASTKQTVKNKYKDYKNVSDWAQDAVLWAIENNVIKGKTDTTIVPYGNALRCEVAQIMYNIFLNDLF